MRPTTTSTSMRKYYRALIQDAEAEFSPKTRGASCCVGATRGASCCVGAGSGVSYEEVVATKAGEVDASNSLIESELNHIVQPSELGIVSGGVPPTAQATKVSIEPKIEACCRPIDEVLQDMLTLKDCAEPSQIDSDKLRALLLEIRHRSDRFSVFPTEVLAAIDTLTL